MIAWHEDDQTDAHLNLDIAKCALCTRNLWSIDGQFATWNGFVQYFQRIAAGSEAARNHPGEDLCPSSSQISQPVDRTSREGFATNSGDRFCGSQDVAFQVWRDQIRADKPCVGVDTWFVSSDHFPVCYASRKVHISSEDTERGFEQKCRETWSDLCSSVDLAWKIVQLSTLEGAPILPQVILFQGSSGTHKVALARYEGYPVLRRFRAITYRIDEIVENVVRHLGIGRACSRDQIRCAVQCDAVDDAVFFAQHEIVGCSDAAFFKVHVMDVAQDSDSETEADLASITTQEGSEMSSLTSEADDVVDTGDEFAMMTMHAPVLCRIPEVIDFSHLRADQVEEPHVPDLTPTEDEEPMMEQHVRDTLDLATRQVRNGPLLVVTFGLGITTLGRRDAECHAEGLAGIVHVVLQLWNDFEAYGPFSFHVSRPQPNLGIARPHIVVLFVVHFNGIPRPWEAAPALVQQAGAPDMIQVPHVYAAWVPRRATVASILRTLDRDRDILPLGPRQVRVFLGNRALSTSQVFESDDGDLCYLEFGAYPEWILDNMRIVDNAERLFVDIHLESERPATTPIAIRCHGISPQNRPLGSRVIWTFAQDFSTMRWLDQARALWPFGVVHPRIVYVGGEVALHQTHGQPAFEYQFIIDYNPTNQIPVLIHQSIRAIEDQTYHAENWAIRLPESLTNADLLAVLPPSHFWVHWPDRVRIYRSEDQPQVMLGERVEMFLYVSARWNILAMLTDHGRQSSDEIFEEYSLLQTAQHSRIQTTAFAEICHAILSDDAKTQGCPFSMTHQPEHCVTQDRSWEDERCAGFRAIPVEKPITLHLHQLLTTADCSDREIGAHLDLRSVFSGTREPEDNLDLRSGKHDDPEIEHGKDLGNIECQPQDLVSDLEHVVQSLVSRPWTGINVDFEIVDHWHPFARAAFRVTPPCTGDASVFHVFTDGSCHRKSSTAAWAFVVIAEFWTPTHGQLFARVGYAGAPLQEDIGAFECTSMDAEATAIIAASEYLLSRVFQAQCPLEIHLHFDCTSVGYGADGTQNIPTQQANCSTRQHDARVMLSLLQRNANVHTHHVHAHTGQPWNEAADSIASWIRLGHLPPVPAVLQSHALLSHALKDWAWLLINPDVELPHLRQILKGGLVHDPNDGFDLTMATAPEQQPNSCQTPQLSTVHVATINVGTLDYRHNQQDVPTSLKARELQRQFSEQGYDVVALQETRARHSQTLQEGHYLRLISAGHHGHAGVELWLHQDLLQAKFARSFSLQENLVVWYQDPRLLCVHLAIDAVGLDIIVAYAPQSGRPDDEIETWWRQLHQVVSERPWSAPMWLLGDLNCHLGSVTTEQVGGLACDLEDIGGRCFREWCGRWNMTVPSTFDSMHAGPTATYTGPRGASTRIDYIAIAQDCLSGVQKSYVDPTVDVMNGDTDHHVLALQLSVQRGPKPRQGFRKKLRYDRECAKAALMSTNHAHTWNLPLIPWNQGTNCHWNEIRNHLQDTMAKAFPKGKRTRRQLYFSEAAWGVLCMRKDVNQQYRSMQKAANQHSLKMLFQAWRGQEPTRRDRYVAHLHCLQLALTFEQRAQCDQEFQRIKRADWKHWIAQQTETRRFQSQQTKGSAIYKVLRPKAAIAAHSGKHRMKLPGLKDQHGVWQRTKCDVAVAWQSQFAQIENAFPTTVQALSGPRQELIPHSPAEALLEIPTLYDFETALRTMPLNKAPGVDTLGAEVYRQCPQVTAQRLFGLLLKISMRGQWPVEFSGGWLMPLFKGKGNHQCMGGYRGILMEAVLARICSRTWRPQVVKGLDSVAAPGQWGGRRGLGVTAVHMQTRLWQQNAAKQKLSLAIIYVDIKAAFYSVAKPLLAGWNGDVQELYALCQIMGIPASARDLFVQHVGQGDWVRQATGSTKTAQIVGSSLAATWFMVPEGNSIQAPKSGSRPGDPLADALFSLVMARILHLIASRFDDAGLTAEWPHCAHVPTQMVTWVDDVAIAIHASADTLSDRTIHALSIVIDCMQEFGFQISCGPGKTAVMMHFHGRGATKARQHAEKTFARGLPVMSEHLGQVMIPLVSQYKHLGGFVVRNNSLLPEIRTRAAQAQARLQPLRRTTKDPGIPLEHRRTIVKSMALSVVGLHSGAWMNLGHAEFSAWSGALFRIYSALQRKSEAGKVDHATFYALADQMQSPMPVEFLHLQKLRLAAQIAAEGDHLMFESLLHNCEVAHDDSWIAGLERSFAWMFDQIGDNPVSDLQHQLRSFAGWESLQELAQTFKKLICKAEKAHLVRIKVMAELQHTDRFQQDLFREMNWTFGCTNEAEPPERIHQCSQCGATFDTAAGMAVHESRMHGRRIAARRFAVDGHCRICQKFFHTRARVVQHLHYSSSGCWWKLMRWLEPCSEAQAADLDQADRLAGEAWHQHGHHSHVKDRIWRWSSPEELVTVLPERCPWDHVSSDPPTDEELQQWACYGLLPPGQGGREVTQRKASPWLIHNAIIDASTLEVSMCEQLRHWCPDHSWIPAPLKSNAQYVLILFSGHRREADIAAWMQWDSAVTPICIDTALDPHFGNLYRTGHWRRMIQAGVVVGLHAGPPCETYTMARWLDCPLQDSEGRVKGRGPRPLRDADFPWGLPARTCAETFQVSNGTLLMLRCLRLVTLALAYGAAVTMEHPKGPPDMTRRWAIWYAAFVRRLLLCAGVTTVTFCQGPLGVPYLKPTTLLVGRLPHLAAALFAAYDVNWRCTEQLGGRNSSGAWRTTRAKAYPPRLCKILAEQFAWFSRQVDRDEQIGQVEHLEDLEALMRPWDPYLHESDQTTMLQDYQPNNFCVDEAWGESAQAKSLEGGDPRLSTPVQLGAWFAEP